MPNGQTDVNKKGMKVMEEHLGKPVYTTSMYQVQIDIMNVLKQILSKEEGCMYEGW